MSVEHETILGRLVMGIGTNERDYRVACAGLKTGEFILVAAQVKGLHMPEQLFKDDPLLSNIPSALMQILRQVHGDDAAKGVLKEARRLVNGSDLNVDKAVVLDGIRELMTGLGRQVVPFTFPKHPSWVENSPTR